MGSVEKDDGIEGRILQGIWPDARFLEHAGHPLNLGPLEGADAKATGVGSCGDSMEVTLVVEKDRILRIGHMPKGCVYTIACASAMSRLAEGRRLEEALAITPQDVEAELGGLPEDHLHCARLAVNTLGEAIGEYYRRGLDKENEQGD